MNPQYEKAILTRTINRYLKTRYSVCKLKGMVNMGTVAVHYTSVLVPGSSMLSCNFDSETMKLRDRVSVPRFSDFIVRNAAYADFLGKLSKL